jgi:hypothetical protein
VRDPEAVGRAALEAAEVLIAKGGKVPLWKEEEKHLKASGLRQHACMHVRRLIVNICGPK